MTEQNRKYVMKEIGKLLSEIWRIKGLAEQECGPQHPITKKLGSMHADAQALLQENLGSFELHSSRSAKERNPTEGNVRMPQYMSTARIARMRVLPKIRILLGFC